ncbi:MAG: FtsX-like permease family protein, partial [Bdellovibrionota bacterium]
GVGADYPLYGSLEMRRADGKLEQLGPGAGKELNLPHLTGKSPIWVSPELALQIGAIHGSSVTFGGKPFVVSGIVEDSSLNSWRGFSLAPTVWVSEAALRATGLIRQGSTATSILRGRIGAENAPLLAEQLKSQLAGQWSGKTDLQLVTAQDASARSTTAITYVGDYLGLMTVVGLLLTAIGGSVLYRLRWRKIRYEIAIYRTLGLTNCGVIGLLLLEVTIMSIAAATLAVTLALTGYPVLQRSLSQYLSFTVDLDQFLKTFLTAYTVSWCATVWTALPAWLEVLRLRPQSLFQDAADSSEIESRLSVGLYWGVTVFLIWLASIGIAHSVRSASFFVLGGSLTALVLWLGFWTLLRTLQTARVFALRWTFNHWQASRGAAFSVLLALGLGTLLLVLPSQIERSIATEMVFDGGNQPSLFLFDIQDDQVSELTDWAAERSQRLTDLTPMIRARLDSLDGTALARPNSPESKAENDFKSREDEQSERSKNRTFNLTERGELNASETLVSGRLFSSSGRTGPDNGLAELSLEHRFADRIGASLGSVLKFNILGMPFEGEVVSIRAVKWATFRPNFFIVVAPGNLEGAPKTWLAASPRLPLKAKAEFQTDLAKQFSNVSAVDVENVLTKLTEVFSLLLLALRLMGAITLGAGIFVMVSLVGSALFTRRREWSLVKVLGGTQPKVQRMIATEFGLLGLVGSGIGVMGGMVVAGTIVTQG